MKYILVTLIFTLFAISTSKGNRNVQLYIDNDEYVCSKLADSNDENQQQVNNNNCKNVCVPSKTEEFNQLKQGMESKGYTYYNTSSFYKIHSRPVNWNTAKLICESEGTHLVVLNSQQEATLVLNLFKAQPPASVSHPEQLIIGLHDQKKEGYWETVTGGTVESSGYSSWYPGNPSGGTSENCGTLHTKNGWLNDFPCHFTATFMCEKEWKQ